MTWPHAPSKIVTGPGLYVVTAATYQKEAFFGDGQRVKLLQEILFELALKLEWELEAWSIFPNHYHFVGRCQQENGVHLLTKRLHAMSAQRVNKLDEAPGRKVWYRSWDTRITNEKSYLARLAYVHNNPAKHLGVSPENYPFCSANWFASQADRSFYETVMNMKIDQVTLYDDF